MPLTKCQRDLLETCAPMTDGTTDYHCKRRKEHFNIAKCQSPDMRILTDVCWKTCELENEKPAAIPDE